MSRREGRSVAIVLAVVGLSVGIGLGSARRLSYHEAIVAQGAREMIAPGGDWLVPTIANVPWLEKPPIAHWMVAGLGRACGRIDETVARLPSALAAAALALTVATIARRRFGGRIGLLAGLLQATSAWVVTRGRLAEVDVILAALIAGVLLAFDRLRDLRTRDPLPWRWVFFALLGATALSKGIGFGAALILAAVAAVLIWDRDRWTFRSLIWMPGWLLAALIALAWPLAVLADYPEALALWAGYVTDRLAEKPTTFAGEPTWAFLAAPLALCLPWTVFSIVGMRRSIGRAVAPRGRFGVDRLLWAWAVAPVAILSMATVKNDHYLIHALAPWSIWAARGLSRLAARSRARRGWSRGRLRRAGRLLMGSVALAWGLGYGLLGTRYDERGREWAWYGGVRSHQRAAEPLVLVYDWDGPDPWDRLPYPNPHGAIPHDLAVRLFYLGAPAGEPPRWFSGVRNLDHEAGPLLLIGRERDLPALRRLGSVEILDRSPSAKRLDRRYVLARLHPSTGIGTARVDSPLTTR